MKIKKKYYVEGMTCASCVSHVQNAVKKIEGIDDVTVNLMSTEMFVTGDEKAISDTKIKKSVENAGYKLVLEENSINDKINKDKKTVRNKLIISIVLSLILFYLCMGPMIGIHKFKFFDDPILFAIVQLILASIVVVINFHYYVNGYKRLFKLSPNMDSLIAIGSSASMIFGIYTIIKIIILVFSVLTPRFWAVLSPKIIRFSSRAKKMSPIIPDKIMGVATRTCDQLLKEKLPKSQ